MSLCVQPAEVLEATLYKQSVAEVVFPRAVTAALFCAAAKCLVWGQLPSPGSLQPHVGEISVLVEI